MSEGASPLAARDIKAAAARWRERQDRADWSADDHAALEEWLSQSSAHRVAYLRVGAAWERTERLVALRSPLPDAQVGNRALLPVLIKIAAALILAITLGISGVRILFQPGERTFSTAIGGHETVRFADGSRIELNTDTVLRTRMTTEQRTVWLDKGEAFFAVRHDATHPFIVMVGDRRVTDLGTQFRISRDTGHIEVAVVQGRVRFEASNSKAPLQVAVLMPGDVATAIAGSMLVTKKTTQALANELAWRRGVLVFRYTPLAEAAAEFNRYNQTKIVIADTQAARLKIYGTFRAAHVEDFTSLAQLVLGLHVKNERNAIVISR